MTTRMKKAGGGNPPATTLERPLSYGRLTSASRAESISLAASILLTLQFPLTAIEEMALWGLLQRHLERGYAGDNA